MASDTDSHSVSVTLTVSVSDALINLTYICELLLMLVLLLVS